MGDESEAKRREGYPNDQRTEQKTCTWLNLAPAGWLHPGAFFRVCGAEKLQKSPRALKNGCYDGDFQKSHH
jgi:hypothetical protein